MKSGFVYAASSPLHPEWVKIGLTRRLPYHRLKELSSTSSVENFDLVDARFVWFPLLTEQWLHAQLVEKGIKRKKEFFQLSQVDASIWLARAQVQIPPPPMDMEDAEDLMHPEDVSTSLEVWEKMAIKGNALASFELGMRALDRHEWKNAWIMFQAAADQGHPDGLVHQCHVGSVKGWNTMGEFFAALAPYIARVQNEWDIPHSVRDLLLAEQSSWSHAPDRAQAYASWDNAKSSRPLRGF